LRVRHAHILDAGGQKHVRDRHARRTGTGHDDPQAVQLPSRQPGRRLQRRDHDDGGAVLIVVEDRDVQTLLKTVLDLEAAGGGDVLEVHPTERRSDPHDRLDDLFGVRGVQADRHRIHAAKLLEQQRFALHDRQGSLRPDVTEAENGRTVGNHKHGVRLPRVVVGQILALRDGLGHPGYAGRVGQSQAGAVADTHSRAYLDLASPVERKCRVVL